MGKSQGLIGNFNGKVGNMVGFKVSQSNNGTSQGVRIYQPVRKNPKTAAQAEQRAKYAPIFATYRALKSIIDRGQESQPYGNASRIAWMKKAFRSALIPWTPQGSTVMYPVGCQLTMGSLPGIDYFVEANNIVLNCAGLTPQSEVNTIGKVSTLLKAGYPSLKDGDQVTIVGCAPLNGAINAVVFSFIIDVTSTEATSVFVADGDSMNVELSNVTDAGAIIVSREGDMGKHLRSTSLLSIDEQRTERAPYDEASKQAAIESYMASGATNDNWAEEPI